MLSWGSDEKHVAATPANSPIYLRFTQWLTMIMPMMRASTLSTSTASRDPAAKAVVRGGVLMATYAVYQIQTTFGGEGGPRFERAHQSADAEVKELAVPLEPLRVQHVAPIPSAPTRARAMSTKRRS